MNPTWDCNSSSVSESSFGFDIHCPATAFLRFTVYESDMFGDPTVIATSVIPVPCIKTGNSFYIHRRLKLNHYIGGITP